MRVIFPLMVLIGIVMVGASYKYSVVPSYPVYPIVPVVVENVRFENSEPLYEGTLCVSFYPGRPKYCEVMFDYHTYWIDNWRGDNGYVKVYLYRPPDYDDGYVAWWRVPYSILAWGGYYENGTTAASIYKYRGETTFSSHIGYPSVCVSKENIDSWQKNCYVGLNMKGKHRYWWQMMEIGGWPILNWGCEGKLREVFENVFGIPLPPEFEPVAENRILLMMGWRRLLWTNDMLLTGILAWGNQQGNKVIYDGIYRNDTVFMEGEMRQYHLEYIIKEIGDIVYVYRGDNLAYLMFNLDNDLYVVVYEYTPWLTGLIIDNIVNVAPDDVLTDEYLFNYRYTRPVVFRFENCPVVKEAKRKAQSQESRGRAMRMYPGLMLILFGLAGSFRGFMLTKFT